MWILGLLFVGLLGTTILLLWGANWGSTPGERSLDLPGDDYFAGSTGPRLVMTRAITVSAAPDRVWPWIAQIGRGAGWYSVDWLDNGRRASAMHVVSWIPEPAPGDATAIGYLRHVDRGETLTWWADGVRFLGAVARLTVCYRIAADSRGTRLVGRMSADASGVTATLALLVFMAMDSIMACSQLAGIRKRVESSHVGQSGFQTRETGARDQYQLYEVIYADGSRAGVIGTEHSARWRQSAIDDGVLPSTYGSPPSTA